MQDGTRGGSSPVYLCDVFDDQGVAHVIQFATRSPDQAVPHALPGRTLR
jgi:hypothetical protein